MIQFDIVQLSRKQYAVIGKGTYLQPEYEELFDSKGGSHIVKVGHTTEPFETTIDDCDETITVLGYNFIGDDFCNFQLHYPHEKCWIFRDSPKNFISKRLRDGINSVVLERQFYYKLFDQYDGFLKDELKFKGLSFDETTIRRSDLKGIITGTSKYDGIRLGCWSIDIKALFEYWWTPQIRMELKKEEYDYPKIYDIEDGLTAAAKLLEIRTKLKKKPVINYVY